MLLKFLHVACPLIIVIIFGILNYITKEWWCMIPVFIVLFDFFVMDWRLFNSFEPSEPVEEVDVRHREHLMCNRQGEVNLFVDFISEEEFKV